MSEANIELNIQHQDSTQKGAFFVEREGERLAEMTYTHSGAKLMIIDHTMVSEKLRGQGVGRKLLQAVVEWARESGTKIIPLCPYAKSVFEKEPALGDVLAGH